VVSLTNMLPQRHPPHRTERTATQDHSCHNATSPTQAQTPTTRRNHRSHPHPTAENGASRRAPHREAPAPASRANMSSAQFQDPETTVMEAVGIAVEAAETAAQGRRLT
jgi:hypothetical protein